MKRKIFTFPSLFIAVFSILVVAYAQDPVKDKLIPYKLMTKIDIPGGPTSFDISWVDSEVSRYYLADRGNASTTPPVPPGIDVIDTKHNQFLFSITGFVRPNGVVAIHGASDGKSAGELWVGDQRDSTIAGSTGTAKVVDLDEPFAAPLSISTGTPAGVTIVSNSRADELAFDPVDDLILIANDRDIPPFVTFISTKTKSVLGHIIYTNSVTCAGVPLVCTSTGIEQAVWDGARRLFYIAIPANPKAINGEVDEIDPTTMSITRRFPTSCSPAGLVLIPLQRLMTSCGDVLDIATGTVLLTVSGVAGDEIWFNPGDERVYFGNTAVPVANGVPPYGVIAHLPTPPLASNQTTHSIAADSLLNRTFVPFTNLGVLVFTDDQDNGFGPPLQ